MDVARLTVKINIYLFALVQYSGQEVSTILVELLVCGRRNSWYEKKNHILLQCSLILGLTFYFVHCCLQRNEIHELMLFWITSIPLSSPACQQIPAMMFSTIPCRVLLFKYILPIDAVFTWETTIFPYWDSRGQVTCLPQYTERFSMFPLSHCPNRKTCNLPPCCSSKDKAGYSHFPKGPSITTQNWSRYGPGHSSPLSACKTGDTRT